MSFLGHVQDGSIVFETPIPLPEGTVVTVVPAGEAPPAEPVVLFSDHYKGLFGLDLDVPPDASANVDHYLYGHPKK